jgi:ATP-dependent DNA helicase 2 subunit 2
LIQKGYQGQIISVKKAYEISQECFAPEVNARPSFGGYLYLGNPYINDHWLAISIDMYLRTKDAKLPTNHKYSALSEVGTHNVAAVSKYALDIRDEESDETKEIEIPKEELRKGYKFGKSMLIVNEEVSNAMKLQTKKEMTIIGFVDAEEVCIFIIVQ